MSRWAAVVGMLLLFAPCRLLANCDDAVSQGLEEQRKASNCGGTWSSEIVHCANGLWYTQYTVICPCLAQKVENETAYARNKADAERIFGRHRSEIVTRARRELNVALTGTDFARLNLAIEEIQLVSSGSWEAFITREFPDNESALGKDGVTTQDGTRVFIRDSCNQTLSQSMLSLFEDEGFHSLLAGHHLSEAQEHAFWRSFKW